MAREIKKWITVNGKHIPIYDEEDAFEKSVDSLKTPDKTIFSDEKVSPLPYDSSKMMEVNFGDWKKEENLVGKQKIAVKDIITTQPSVQANKLKKMKGSVDTSDVPVLQIGNKYYLSDGNHRIVANVLSGKKEVEVEVYRRKR